MIRRLPQQQMPAKGANNYVIKKKPGLGVASSGGSLYEVTLDINPLVIVPDKNVTVIFTDDDFVGRTAEQSNNAYEITISVKKARELAFMSWLKNQVTVEDIVTGIFLHEVGHVKYTKLTTFNSVKPLSSNTVGQYIFNVLEDARIEYQMTQEYPSYSQYITILLSALKQMIHIQKGARSGNALQNILKLEQFTAALFDFVRYGNISADKDMQQFYTFMVPFALSAVRGDMNNCINVANIIFTYLCKATSNAPETERGNTTVEEATVSQKEAEEVAKQFQTAMQKQSNVAKNIEQVKDAKAGQGNTAIEAAKDGSVFFNSTVAERASEIAMIRSIFKRVMNKPAKAVAFDGDLNPKRQQEAYVGYLLGEEGKDYFMHKMLNSSIDAVILRDVSGSTDGFKVEYAKAVVMLLAAIDGIPGIRCAEIDFSDDAMVTKTFDQKLSNAKIEPVIVGGTSLSVALAAMLRFDFKGLKRICYIITDGEWYDKDAANHLMRELNTKHKVQFKEIRVVNGSSRKANGYTTLEDLPNLILNHILEEVAR